MSEVKFQPLELDGVSKAEPTEGKRVFPARSMHSRQVQVLLTVIQVSLFVLYGVFGGSMDLPAGSFGGATAIEGYGFYLGITVMMVIGFGYLMTFLKWYGLSSVGFCLLVTAIAVQWGLLTEAFFHNVAEDHWVAVELNVYSFVNIMAVTAVPLISFGAIIGKVSPLQLIVMVLIEMPCRSLVTKVLLEHEFEVADIGGSYTVHMFGCYFGLACAWMLGRPKTSPPDAATIPDMFSFIGTIFLWIYWPSFVGGLADANSSAQQSAFGNTILALCSGTVASFLGSSYFANSAPAPETGKFRPVDIQNACLAGGVAIGAVADFDMNPCAALVIGFVAGLISTYGYNVLQPWLEKNLALHDTCGINNLHGMPSVIGAIASIFTVSGGMSHSVNQLWSLIVLLATCIPMGLATGYVLKMLDLESKDVAEEKQFHDNVWWEVANDFGMNNSNTIHTLVGVKTAEQTMEQSLVPSEIPSRRGSFDKEVL